jgi:hypothetical protein
MTEAQIKHMVDRFLMWKLPENWNPDGGISFEKTGSAGTPYEYVRQPVGTNLLSAVEADAMVRHLLEGLPEGAERSYIDEGGNVRHH